MGSYEANYDDFNGKDDKCISCLKGCCLEIR